MSTKIRVKKLETRTIPAEPSGRSIEKAKTFISSWVNRGIYTPWNDGSEESKFNLARQMEKMPGPDHGERLQRVLKCSSQDSTQQWWQKRFDLPRQS